MKLTDYLPGRLLSPPVKEFEEALQPAIDRLNEALLGITGEELFAHSAKEWLPLWEKAYGLETDPEKPLAERQARLMSKMRGTGTATVELLRQTAAGFAGFDCKILEYPREYRFAVRLLGLSRIPPNMADMRAALEERKPAHLVMEFSVLESSQLPEQPLCFRAPSLTLKSGFSNERRPVVRFNGSESFDGEILFAQGGGISLSSLAVSAVFLTHSQSIFSGTLTASTMWTFDDGVPFDGSKKFNAGSIQEPL